MLLKCLFKQEKKLLEHQPALFIKKFWLLTRKKHFLQVGLTFFSFLFFFLLAVGHNVPPEKTQSHLKSQFAPEMALLKSQQNLQTHLKSNFLFTPISNICFQKVFKMTGVKLTIEVDFY